jgi:hypothetical protein
MLHVALLAAVLTTSAPASPDHSPIQRCLSIMDGAVYHGDPNDRPSMKAALVECRKAVNAATHTRVEADGGPAKLFITARLLDRAATLSYMGLDDASGALRDVKSANLYFRIAAGLPHQSADFHAAALANVELTAVQLQTLHTDIASRATSHATSVALRRSSPNEPQGINR